MLETRLRPLASCSFSVLTRARGLASSSTPSSQLRVAGGTYRQDAFTNVTNAIIQKAETSLLSKPSHPLSILNSLIHSHFPDYKAITPSSPVVSVFKNFDELGFPPDHPGRRHTDSYYVNKEQLLRTHASAHQIESFQTDAKKWLLTADVYRRDEIDASHYPVFHQMDGARVFDKSPSELRALEEENEVMAHRLAQENILIEDESSIGPQNPYQQAHDPAQAALVAANLKHTLNGLMLKLFGGAAGATKENPLRVRWIDAYFPFTSPSYEVEVFFRGKWLEILGCGVVNQAILDRAGVKERISWAFGLGLERIAMVLFSIPDIRLFWSQDPRFLSQFTPGVISTFKEFSKFPSNWKDVSFWISRDVHENDVCDIVREAAGDLAEDVKEIDRFVHPQTSKTSLCYRIHYRSMERSLSNAEISAIQDRLEGMLVSELGVEIR
ncbi:phenylalanyl-tRNA synthetase [Sistotremastrum niveocremeum HHB9708]|uniref:Phenylalanine--tRNA ligase, mitochondrial n=1 Tax=Sistotremastrum niveocremeum HHB9708 TaxID=1314777 RepID=A0A164QRB3_9AGAM|nr:phenylalanyl-tRNA synthetase [Sistotremastrum niveocremeum HHB9708]